VALHQELFKNDATHSSSFHLLSTLSPKVMPMSVLQYQLHAHESVHYADQCLWMHAQSDWQVAVPDLPLIQAHHLLPAYQRLAAAGMPRPPLSVLLAEHTPALQILHHFVPLISHLHGAPRQQFLATLNHVGNDQRLRVHLHRTNAERAPAQWLRLCVTLQLTCCFWARPDILATVLASQPTFAFFVTQTDYLQAGGVGGGCYLPSTHTIMLVTDRLCEGYRTTVPSISPLLHELGHLLDGTCMRQNGWNHPRGELPNMTLPQRKAWYRAKQQEVTTYQYWQAHHDTSQIPFGHPYVFQTDGEFLAGYWELFWRSPRLLQLHVPELYAVLHEYVQFDVQRNQPADYTGYHVANQQSYANGERHWPCHMQWLTCE
jgi:hypothetical protein